MEKKKFCNPAYSVFILVLLFFTDINECFQDGGVCGIHNCLNKKGTHKCECKQGYNTDEKGQCAKGKTI